MTSVFCVYYLHREFFGSHICFISCIYCVLNSWHTSVCGLCLIAMNCLSNFHGCFMPIWGMFASVSSLPVENTSMDWASLWSISLCEILWIQVTDEAHLLTAGFTSCCVNTIYANIVCSGELSMGGICRDVLSFIAQIASSAKGTGFTSCNRHWQTDTLVGPGTASPIYGLGLFCQWRSCLIPGAVPWVLTSTEDSLACLIQWENLTSAFWRMFSRPSLLLGFAPFATGLWGIH